MTEADPSPHSRARAKRACLHCNRRRIRCNVLEMSPCHNCRSMNVPCEIGISRRGKYPRKKAQHREDSTAPTIQSGIPSSPGTPAQSNPRGSPSRQRDSYTSPSTNQLARLNSPGHTVFLGESSPLTAVIDEGHRSPHKGFPPGMQGTRLHYLVPERLDHNNSRDEALRTYKLKKEAQLQDDGAFSFPPREISQLLLQAYFKWFHPCFPVLDRAEIHLAYENGNLSPFLLQAIHFIGVSLCTDAVFSQTNYETRYRAKFLFHSRARAIYDADWETDKIIKLQALFLLSFWRGGPSEERDTRFWLEVAISLAQKKGMHMMSKLSFQSSREEKTWRRIWWALYVRDQQSAAALGLPPRIRDEDCDVTMLSIDDLRDNEPIEDQHLSATRNHGYLHYPIEMAKLARILRKIVSTQYIPMRSSADASYRAHLRQELQEWEANLPVELRLERASTPDMTFLIGLLHMTYNNLYILLYRSLFLHACDGLTDEGNIALEAATRSTRIIEDMLSHNLVQHGPTHLITHAFSTLCIQTIHCRRTTGTMRKLAEHRARLCLLGLQELQKSWDLENWVLNLFFRCLDDTTARTLRSDGVLITKATCGVESAEHTDNAFNPEATETQVRQERPSNPVLVSPSLDVPESASTDLIATNEYYGLFNFTDDYTDVLGTYPSEADSLNLQNLEFLYRFL